MAGRARWVEGFLYPVKDGAGRVEQLVLMHQDVTERREAEALILASLGCCPQSAALQVDQISDPVRRARVAAWVERTSGRRLDPQLVAPAQIRWYAAQMAATPAHVVSEFQRRAQSNDPGAPALHRPRRATAGAAGCPDSQV